MTNTTATTITTSVHNASTGSWEVIDREPGTSLDGAQVSAQDIGGELGQPLLIELRDADDAVLESVQIEAS